MDYRDREPVDYEPLDDPAVVRGMLFAAFLSAPLWLAIIATGYCVAVVLGLAQWPL